MFMNVCVRNTVIQYVLINDKDDDDGADNDNDGYDDDGYDDSYDDDDNNG